MNIWYCPDRKDQWKKEKYFSVRESRSESGVLVRDSSEWVERDDWWERREKIGGSFQLPVFDVALVFFGTPMSVFLNYNPTLASSPYPMLTVVIPLQRIIRACIEFSSHSSSCITFFFFFLRQYRGSWKVVDYVDRLDCWLMGSEKVYSFNMDC